NDILDFSLMEAGKLTLHSTPFSLVEFYAEISQITEVLAQQKKIYFTVKPLPEGLPEKVLADEARLKQALLNVIGNAVKFTAKGFIKISVHWIETRSDTVSLEFVVQDTGVGILDSDLPRLFKPYMQADQKRTRRFGGTGLGLAITASIVEAFGGKIAVQSTKGVGSWFSLQIPLKIAPKEKKPQFPSAVQNESTQKIADSYPLHILVVEDEPVNQIVITESLRLLGYEARVVSSGFEAINLVEKEDFDLILMDIQMPALSGIEATERILQLPERAHCKIIAVTADTSNENRNQCAAAGMVDFLMKPYTLPALREVILKWAKKNHL
ncbi:MAG TPA: response regulator, partial [Turneriella sp.]|nr:response regulator [Turneriella sp.]